MKSKVILFNVLLFWSNIVDSVPHSEDHVRQRVNPLSNWQVNQNAPNAQYLHTDFTQTRNVNIQPEKTQDYYTNQERRPNYDSNVYNRSPASSPSAEDLLVSYDSPTDGSRLDSYPPRVEPYPSRTSQVGFENQQYRNQNWRPQNQYTKPAPSAVLIPDDERPLVTTVQEPYRSPVQYLQPKYVPSTNRRFYHPGRSYLTREQVQYPLTDNRKYVDNSAPRFYSSGSVPYENYGEDQVAASKIKTRPIGARRYTHSIAPQSGITYNEAPAVIAPDTLTDQSENIEVAENYRSRPVLSNSATITNQDIRSPLISEPDNNSDTSNLQSENIEVAENYRSRPVLSNSATITNQDVRSPLISEPDNNSDTSNLAHINTEKEAPVIISKILSEKPLARRYAHNYRPGSGRSNIVGDDSINGAVNEPVEVKSGKYEANYGPREPVPINTNSEAPSAPSDTVLVNSGSNKREESNIAYRPTYVRSPTPTNTNTKQNVYSTISSGEITEYNLSSFVSKPEIQDILAKSNKRYVVVHPNGTIEFLDTIDLGSLQNSKLRLVHHKRKNIDGSDSDGVLTQQSPENLPDNIAKTPFSVDEYPLPTNNEPADDKNPTPLNVDQAKPADQYDSNKSPPLKDLPANHSNLKPSPQQEKQPADNNNSKLLTSSSTSNKDQSTQNGNLKPLPQDVNQLRNDDDSKTLIPPVNQSAADGNSKPLSQDGNKPVEQKNQSADDYNLKPLTSKEDQPANDDNSKLDQTKDENNFTPLFPNTKQPAHIKKPKSHDDKPFNYYRRHPAHYHKSKHSHVNQPADNNNSNPSSPGESQPASDSNSWPSNEDQSGGKTDSASLLPYKNHPVHRYKPKSRYSHYQAADDNPLTTPKRLTYPENQPGGDKNSNPSSRNENAPENNDNSKPLPSNEHQSGDETDSTSLTSHNKHQSHHYTRKSRHSHDQSTDDNKSTPLATQLLNYPENQPGDDDNSNPSSPSEDQTGDDNDSEPLPVNGTQPANNTKSKPIHGAQPGNDNNSNSTSPVENQPEEYKKSKPLRPNENQPTDDLKAKPTSADASKNDDQSNSTTVSPIEPNYTTSSKPEVIKTHKRKHIHRTSTTNSPVVSTTPYPDDTSEDPIITLSPIEKTTDNVSDVPPVATTTTTTTRPVKTPGKSDNDANNKQDDGQDGIARTSSTSSTTTVSPSTSTSPTGNISDDKTKVPKENENTQTKDKTDGYQVNNPEKDTQTVVSTTPYPDDTSEDQIITKTTDNVSDVPPVATTTTTTTRPVKTPGKSDNDANNKQDDGQDGITQTSSTTTVSPSTSTSPTGTISDDKTKGPKENENSQTKDKTDGDQVNNPEKDTQTAVYNSSELFDKNTDVPAESDDYSSVTGSPSVQNDVDTGDASGDNSSELKQSETDVTITVSSSTANDSEDEIIIINVEVSESTVVSTTPYPDDTSEDQIITLSPIEQTTDNVSDVPPVATTTTTTTRPVKTPGKSDNDANNKQDDGQDGITQTSSTTTVSPSTSTSPTGTISDDKTKGPKENENSQTKDKTDGDQVNNPEKDTQTAVYNSSELFDKNTDVPAESDDYSSVTGSPSVQNDVDTGDASGDNSSELKQSETDVTITVSSSTANDSEDEIIIINVEVSESTVVSTTPYPDDTSEDQIITLSPIEQTTDNVSDVPPVATTTTTTTRPVKTPGKSDNDANNKQDDGQDGITQTSSTTTVSPSTSTSPTGNISDDKTKAPKENENTQTKDKTDVDQVNNPEKDTQTAVYNSSELFDTNTDVPAESDDYSSVTASPSVQNDVDTGDASGDNSSELEQSETDITITVSGSTANDSEDEIITINIEVSESTDDADSSGTDKSLVVSMDTNDSSDDDSKTPKPEDCKKDHNNNGKGKNVEIDMSNLKGEPTMWIRTTNQDFVDKLTAKNDTEYDLIYFFHIENQPAIEREKTTTIYCNGTVVTEIIEITYANKDDLTPTIVKTTQITNREDYRADEV